MQASDWSEMDNSGMITYYYMDCFVLNWIFSLPAHMGCSENKRVNAKQSLYQATDEDAATDLENSGIDFVKISWR